MAESIYLFVADKLKFRMKERDHNRTLTAVKYNAIYIIEYVYWEKLFLILLSYGTNIAQRIRLRLPSWSPGIDSYLCLFQFIFELWCEKGENQTKPESIVPYFFIFGPVIYDHKFSH